MKPITQSELIEFVNLTGGGASYDYHKKKRYRFLGRKILKEIAERLGLPKESFTIHFNPGGPAVDGDHTLHTDKFYLALHDNIRAGWFYYRTCKGRKDFTGGHNHPYTWPKLTAYGLGALVDKLKEIQFPLCD